MHNFFFKSFILLKWTCLFLLFVLLIVYFILRASLPDLDGTKIITLLNQSVQIARDAQGIPTIRAKYRQDTAFALGYVHAQERYFQMDLLRRKAAGELAELLGDAALESDIKVKLHRFKQRAQQIIRKLPRAHYSLLMAYSHGVNAGIEAFEKSMKQAGIDYQIFIYEGAKHAFNNDANPSRYHEEAAKLAWKRTIGFFKEKLKD